MAGIRGAQDAQRRLERDYEALKQPTLRALSARLRSRRMHVPAADLEAYYNQAWHALFERLAAGTAVADAGAYLVLVAYRRAVDDVRRLPPWEHAGVDLETLVAPDDVVQQVDDRRRLRELVEALREELDERERVAASLCYLHGHTRAQAAEVMGLSAGRMKKVMDGVSKAVGRITREIDAGTRCEARTSANTAYAIGLLDPESERYAAVRAHLEGCPSCRADVLRMRGLAAIAPPVLLPWGVALGGGPAAGDGRSSSGGSTTAQGSRFRNTLRALAAAAIAAVLGLATLAVARGGDRDAAPLVAPPQVQAAVKQQRTAPSPTPTTPASAAAPPARTGRSKPAPRPARRASTPVPTPARAAAAVSSAPAPVAVEPASTGAATARQAPAPRPAQPLEDGRQEFGLEP